MPLISIDLKRAARPTPSIRKGRESTASFPRVAPVQFCGGKVFGQLQHSQPHLLLSWIVFPNSHSSSSAYRTGIFLDASPEEDLW